LEDHGSDGSLLAPVRDLLISLARRPESVERRGPTRICSNLSVQCWGAPLPDVTTFVHDGLERWGVHQLKCGVDGLLEGLLLEVDPPVAAFEELLAPGDLGSEFFMAFPGDLELFVGDDLDLGRYVLGFDLVCEAVSVSVLDAALQSVL